MGRELSDGGRGERERGRERREGERGGGRDRGGGKRGRERLSESYVMYN